MNQSVSDTAEGDGLAVVVAVGNSPAPQPSVTDVRDKCFSRGAYVQRSHPEVTKVNKP